MAKVIKQLLYYFSKNNFYAVKADLKGTERMQHT